MRGVLRGHLGENRLGIVVVHVGDDVDLVVDVHLTQDRCRLLGREAFDQVGGVLVGDFLDEIGGLLRRQRGQDLLPMFGCESKQRAKCLAGADAVDVGLQCLAVAGGGEFLKQFPGLR